MSLNTFRRILRLDVIIIIVIIIIIIWIESINLSFNFKILETK
jgi:hypothetical protein